MSMDNIFENDSMEEIESRTRRFRFAPNRRAAKRNHSPPSPDRLGLRGYPAGMENLESGKTDLAPVEPLDNSFMDMFFGGYPPEMYDRRGHALHWRNCQIGEEKFCISACGALNRWSENLFGFPRVVVHGVDSICVVARTKDLEHVIHEAVKVRRIVWDLKNALIYEAEDLALPPDEGIKLTSRSFEKPFIAVTVVPGTNSGNEASDDEYDVDRAIKFLKEQMASGTTFNFDKTLKTAIFTLEHLFCKTFKATEIQVFYMKNHIGRVVGGNGCSEEVKEFPARAERSIMDHLDVINKPCSGGSSGRRLVVINKPCSRGSHSRKRGLDVIHKAHKRLRRVT